MLTVKTRFNSGKKTF